MLKEKKEIKKYLLIVILFFCPHSLFAQDKISNLITPVSYFIDRPDLLTTIKNNIAKYRKTSIVGISGIGKTQLARTYAYENQDNYDLIWFIDCNLDLNEEFLKLAKEINREAHSHIVAENLTTVKEAVIDYLTYQDKWLIIFDNLKIQKNQKVQEFVTWEHNGDVIFCSQDNEIIPHIIRVKQFGEHDAIALASDILESKEQEFATWLAQEFRGYPVLIVQGAQLLNNVQGLSKEEYKKKIRQSANKISSNISLAMNELTLGARRLISKIALINNQSFSKEFLSFLSDKSTLDNDIYQLAKFELISNIDSSETNPIFEMHDIVAEKIVEINGNKNNKYLKEMIITIARNLENSDPANIYMSCTYPTVSENLEIILKNTEKYSLDINLILDLRNLLLVTYLNTYDRYKAEELIDWFITKKDSFNVWAMNDYQKNIYAGYLGLIGYYNEKDLSDFKTSITFVNKALKILETLKLRGLVNLKYNYLGHVAICQAWLGNINLAQEAINKLEILSKHKELKPVEIDLIQYRIKAVLFFLHGKYAEALEQINKDAEAIIKYTKAEDLLLTESYLLKSKILNYLGQYQKAYVQAEQLYNMFKLSKKENHTIFASIFTEIARAKLGLGDNMNEALEYVQEAIGIFLADKRRNPESNYIDDPDLAYSYVVQGEIFFALDRLPESIVSYRKALNIYLYLYQENRKNVAQISYLYLQGAKAACKAQDLFFYKAFGKAQIKEFTIQHPNTTEMLKYCNSYNMDLWAD